jgi:hypothetical protein
MVHGNGPEGLIVVPIAFGALGRLDGLREGDQAFGHALAGRGERGGRGRG